MMKHSAGKCLFRLKHIHITRQCQNVSTSCEGMRRQTSANSENGLQTQVSPKAHAWHVPKMPQHFPAITYVRFPVAGIEFSCQTNHFPFAERP